MIRRTNTFRDARRAEGPGHSPSPGQRPGERERMCAANRPNGPTVLHRRCRRTIGRWAESMDLRCSSPRGPALGWENRAPSGLSTQRSPGARSGRRKLAAVGTLLAARLQCAAAVTLMVAVVCPLLAGWKKGHRPR